MINTFHCKFNKLTIFNKKFIITSILYLLISLTSLAQEPRLPFHVSHFTLKNGLHVVLSEDNSLPLVSVVVAYNVGSVNEERGKTGLAYLMESLMFQGSKHVSRMQHIIHINKIGGELNAITTEEKTIYHQTVPSNQLALVLWLESDRMHYLEITDSKVEKAKDSLIEEIQYRKATDPYLESLFVFDQLILPDFAYSHPVIGDEIDLRAITLEDVKKFYSTFYTPNNAVLCVVGNINRRNAEALIRKYFESIPKGDETLTVSNPESFKKKSENKSFKDSLAPIPGFYLGYRLVPPHSEDFYPLEILEYVLLRGKSSRLHKRLFERERIVYSYSGRIEKWKNFSVFKLFVLGNNEIMVNKCKRAIYSEIGKLKTVHISEKELTKSKNMFKMDYIRQYYTPLERALFLTNTFLARGTLDHLHSELDKYLSVSVADIIGVANKYFTPENRILLTVKIK